ncbi:MAG: DUF4402 domain-containing protein [Novosphingobium sp.]|nr:DUF4402 domain-containing protein [Novosphingobium sp.]
MKKIAMVAVAAVLATGTAHAAPTGNSSTADGAATATIVAPIVLTHVESAVLSFGTFTTGGGGSVVVSAADGTGSDNGEVGFVSGSTTSADEFTVTGDPLRTFGIVTRRGTVTGVNSGDTMDFRTTPSAPDGALDGTGNASFTVGGRLTVAGTESPDVYEGTYEAEVSYN